MVNRLAVPTLAAAAVAVLLAGCGDDDHDPVPTVTKFVTVTAAPTVTASPAPTVLTDSEQELLLRIEDVNPALTEDDTAALAKARDLCGTFDAGASEAVVLSQVKVAYGDMADANAKSIADAARDYCTAK